MSVPSLYSSEYMLTSEIETTALAAQFAQVAEFFIQQGITLYLEGDLGAGKTFFTQQLLRAWGYSGAVKSPTYGLVEVYSLPIGDICHFDLYRLNAPEELEDMGFREYWGPGQLCVVEWPMRGGNLLPSADVVLLLQGISCELLDTQLLARRAVMTARSHLGVDLLRRMKESVKK